MKIILRTLLTLVILVGALLSWASCGWPVYITEPFDITVVDAETGAPLAGVNAVGYWRMERPGFHGKRFCGVMSIRETETDGGGRFHFDRAVGFNPRLCQLQSDDPRILIYKAGYEPRRLSSYGPPGRSGMYRSSPFDGARIELVRARTETLNGTVMMFTAFDYELEESMGPPCLWEQVPRMLAATTAERTRIMSRHPRAELGLPDAAQVAVRCSGAPPPPPRIIDNAEAALEMATPAWKKQFGADSMPTGAVLAGESW